MPRIKMVGRYLAHKFFITPQVAEIFLENKRNKKKGRSQKTLTYMREYLSGSSGAVRRLIITHIISIRNEFQVSRNQFLHTKRRIKLLCFFLFSNDKISLVLNIIVALLSLVCAISIGITGTVYLPAVVIVYVA